MLANLKLAIAGTIVMSPDLADALDALFMARVPATWTKVSQLVAPNMGVWFVNILTRAEQFTNWLRSGRPSSFWLTGFFNPTGFLTANRQEVCRKHSKDGWALDDVIDASEVLRQERDEVKKGPEEGIYIYGLYLDCAKWDKEKNRLADSDPKVGYYLYMLVLLSAPPYPVRHIDIHKHTPRTTHIPSTLSGAFRATARAVDHRHARLGQQGRQERLLHVPHVQGAQEDGAQLHHGRRPAHGRQRLQVDAPRRGAADHDGVRSFVLRTRGTVYFL